MCWGLKRTRAEWYQRALFAGDGWKEIRQPLYDFFLCPFSGERKKVSPSSLFHPFSDSHKVWDIWWFMGRGREEKKEMEKRRGRGGKGVQTWCKPFGGARGGCQHSLLCLNWGGSDRIYSMPATSLSPRTRAHTLSVLRSVAGHWLRSVFVIVILCFFTSPLRPPPLLLSLLLLLQSMRLGGKHEGKDKGAQGDQGDNEEEDGTENFKTEHKGGWEVSVFPQHPSMT